MMGIIYEYAKNLVLYKKDVKFENHTSLIRNFKRKLGDLDIFKKTFGDSRVFRRHKQILGYFRNFRIRDNAVLKDFH